ncbi:MAG: cyclic nucleotide-binding domain-containing protein, partial [Planctomycetota bacterium]
MTDTIDVPTLLQELVLFGDLKKGDLKKLNDEKHCQLFRYAAGENIVRQGELDTEFYVILDGIASAYRMEDDGQSRRLSSFVAGDWFGEMSAISHQARSATVQADTPCTVVMLDVTMFQMLFGNKKGKFREMIDARYKETALAHHLDTA